MRLIALLYVIATLTGCTELPDIEDGVTAADEAAEYPDLIELSPAVQAQALEEDETSPQLEARASGLRARAAALQSPVISDAERARLTGAGG